MVFFKRSRGNKSGEAPLKEVALQNEDDFKVEPERLRNKTSGNKVNVIGRALTDPNTSQSQPTIVDHAHISRKDRQILHRDHLFGLGQKYVEEMPAERRQSLVTEGTTAETPPEPIPFGSGEDPQIAQTLQAEKDNSRGEVQPGITGCTTMFDMTFWNFAEYSDSLCGQTPETRVGKSSPCATGLADKVEILEHSVPIPIPGAISFSKKKNFPSPSDTNGGYDVLNFMEELKENPPSLLERLRQRKKVAKVTVYVDKPQTSNDWSSDASVDNSTLTTPFDCR